MGVDILSLHIITDSTLVEYVPDKLSLSFDASLQHDTNIYVINKST